MTTRSSRRWRISSSSWRMASCGAPDPGPRYPRSITPVRHMRHREQGMRENGNNAASARLILTGGTVVTRDLVIDSGSVVIEGERIVEVSSATYPAAHSAHETVVDMTGRLVLPGIICLHNDGHERA